LLLVGVLQGLSPARPNALPFPVLNQDLARSTSGYLVDTRRFSSSNQF
jgi:hypothetical protein